MKNIFFLFALSFSQTLFAQAFEGTIKATLQTEQGNVHYLYFLRSDQNATDVTIEGDKAVRTRIYFNKSTQQIRLAWENAGQKFRSKWLPTTAINATTKLNYNMLEVKKTEEHKEILGYQCYKYIFDFPTHKITAFITNDIAIDVDAYIAYQKDDLVVNAMAYKDIKGYPLETEITQKAPLQVSRYRVSQIIQKRPDDAVFEVGEEYKEQ